MLKRRRGEIIADDVQAEIDSVAQNPIVLKLIKYRNNYFVHTSFKSALNNFKGISGLSIEEIDVICQLGFDTINRYSNHW